ncbi:homoserine kinase [Ignicoccus pacificus DSM 13166]|uniref:Homoserine kinase n=1 Tax=Ignicoccus pacificus DSM 13166 TaxID=940294 RepID=A0A977K8X4_9CREN|nr:homoserine kinase [Ignicoccus pacificus DSM 13166]
MWVCARAFSSSANLGPGYDVLAIAHDAYYDIVCVRPGKETSVTKLTGPFDVPKENNNAIPAIKKALEFLGEDMELEVWIHKGVPPGRGLGSSGATAAAAVKAVELLLGQSLPWDKAVEAAAEGERFATGSAHADNVAASYLGGLVMVMYNPLKVVKLGMPNVKFVVATPWHEVPEGKTGEARKVLPAQIALKDAVEMVAGSLAVVNGFLNNDMELLARGLEMDPVVTPARARLIPCYEKVKEEAKKAGALAFTISGAGPSVMILGDEKAGEASVRAWEECGIKATYKLVKPAPGASAHPPPSQ